MGQDPNELLPLRPVAYQVLLALADGERLPAAPVAGARKALEIREGRKRFLEIAGEVLADARVRETQQQPRGERQSHASPRSATASKSTGNPSAIRRREPSAWASARRPLG